MKQEHKPCGVWKRHTHKDYMDILGVSLALNVGIIFIAFIGYVIDMIVNHYITVVRFTYPKWYFILPIEFIILCIGYATCKDIEYYKFTKVDK